MVDSSSHCISLYFHIPFCKKKCGYCHFYVIPDKDAFKEALMEGLRTEWQLRLPLLHDKEVVSVYFGGGTPFLLGPEKVGEILSWIAPLFSKEEIPEITLEANPEFIDKASIEAFASIGINRVSMGVQSFDDVLLQRLTRDHDAKSASAAVLATAQAGITNISIDLMYDIPGQTVESWQRTLEQAAALPITHLSLYNLTIEPHTSFFKHKNRLEADLPDEEASAQMYKNAVSTLAQHGLDQYEISAFARDDKQSRHNVGYWIARPFLGFGPSAFSYWEGARFRNIANLNRYCALLRDKELPIDFDEQLDDAARRRELLAVNIRLKSGVDLDAFERRHGSLEQEVKSALKELLEQGLVEEGPINAYRLTEKGILFYDTVAVALI